MKRVPVRVVAFAHGIVGAAVPRRPGSMMSLLVVATSHLMILPLTWLSLRWLRVPERHELIAGSFLTIVYALFASMLAALVVG